MDTLIMGHLETAKLIVLEAGDILRLRFHENVSFSLKEDNTYISEADMESHVFIKKKLRKHFPFHDIVSEEDGQGDFPDLRIVASDDKKQESNDYLWVVDPLDGTSNFIHRIPYFCVTIACFKVHSSSNLEPILGVTYNPITQELYFCEKGQGVFKKEVLSVQNQTVILKRFAILNNPALHHTFAACGFHGDMITHDYDRKYPSFIQKVDSSRRLGSAALDLARTAEGVFHLFFDPNVKIWDVAAGALFIQEVGGACANFPKSPHTGSRHFSAKKFSKTPGTATQGIIAGASTPVTAAYRFFTPSNK